MQTSSRNRQFRTVHVPWAVRALGSLWPQVLLALGILVHLGFLVALKTGWLNFLFNDSAHRFGPGDDFFSIYAAGVQVLHGHSAYQVAGPVTEVPYGYPFRYAPLVAYTLASFLTLLPAVHAYGLWLILLELALVRNIRLTFENAPDRTRACLGAAMWLLFTPYFLEIFTGQFTFLTGSLVFWAYMAWQEGQTGNGNVKTCRAGDLFWATAFFLKMMPLLFLPLALLQKRWKVQLLAIVILIATSILYFLKFPADWKLFLATNTSPRPFFHAGNQGLMALVYAVTNGNMHRYLSWRGAILVCCGGISLWLIFVALKNRTGTARTEEDGQDAQGRQQSFAGALLYLYAGLSAAYLLTYKDVWEHHYTLLMGPLVLLAIRKERTAVWLPPFLICALPTLFALYDVRALGSNDDPQEYWTRSLSLLHHFQKPLAPLWLMTGILLSSFPLALSASRRQKWIAWRQTGEAARGIRIAGVAATLLVCGGLSILGHTTVTSIRQQRRLTDRLMVPFDVVYQQRPETCGPASLAAVCHHFGVEATENEIAGLAGTTPEGTSMLGLQEAAHSKGLKAEGWQVDTPELERVPRPCILFMHTQGMEHFVVLVAVRGDNYYIADPVQGRCVWSGTELNHRRWKGEVLVIGPPNYMEKL
jgi:predicted double-glycine peptidase